MEATEPEQPGSAAGTGPHGDPAAGIALPTSIKVGSWSIVAELVMDLSPAPTAFVRGRASSVKRGRALLAHRAAELYLPEVTEMPRI